MGRKDNNRKRKQQPYMRQHRKKEKEERDARGVVYHGKNKDFTIVRESQRFNNYYKQLKIVPEEEWDAFIAALQRDLPISFRISRNGYDKAIQEKLMSGAFGKPDQLFTRGEGLGPHDKQEKFGPPTPLEWYPEQKAWTVDVGRKELKSLKEQPELRELHNFIVAANDQGNINRQEAVSMIPPLLLDVQPHHKVLDVCAAPGSKTAQLMEALHATKDGSQPTGFIMANDADPKRAYMLVHQLKRLGSANYVVTTHEGQSFPDIFEPNSGDKKVKICFDRILCDVPCGGDGTLRKNPHAWKQWDTGFGMGLHPLQIQIAMRSLQMLKVGGMMTYSTCSFNPIENESVVAELLRLYEGGLELVDVSGMLKGFKREPGWKTWRVCDKNELWYDKHEEVPDRRKQKVKPSMFAPTEEEAFHLDRCMRVNPHKQNTGGFFIALLRKTAEAPIRVTYKPEITHPAAVGPVPAAAESYDAATAHPSAIPKPRRQRHQPRQPSEEHKRDEPMPQAAAPAAPAAASTDPEAPSAVAAPAAPAASPAAEPKDERRRSQHTFQEDNFEMVADEAWENLVTFYGLEGLSKGCFLKRSKSGRKLYSFAPYLASVLLNQENYRLHVVHGGLRAFEGRPDNKEADGDTKNYHRVVEEGVNTIAASMTRQIFHPDTKTFLSMVDKTTTPMLAYKQDDELWAELGDTTLGSIVAVLDTPESALICTKPIHCCFWRTEHGITAMVSKQLKKALFNMLGFEGEEERKQAAQDKIRAANKAARNAEAQAKKLANAAATAAGSPVQPVGAAAAASPVSASSPADGAPPAKRRRARPSKAELAKVQLRY